VDIMYGEGVSREGSLLDIGTNIEIIEKSGAWYSYGDLKLGQGRENAKQYLKDHKELADEIEKKIRENYNLAFDKIKSSADDSMIEN
ncbi:MAG: recombination protein RecA, partial [Thermoanaerobacterium sp.]|nr:recombination protein RecA [Thermoanaerobacterium sp.]